MRYLGLIALLTSILTYSCAHAADATSHCAIAAQQTRDAGLLDSANHIGGAHDIDKARGQCIASDGKRSLQLTFDETCADVFEKRCTHLLSAVDVKTGDVVYADIPGLKRPGALSPRLPASESELCDAAKDIAARKYRLKLPSPLNFHHMMYAWPDRTCFMRDSKNHDWRLGIIAKCEQVRCLKLNTVYDADGDHLLLNRHLKP